MKTQTYAGDRRNYDPDSYIGTNGRFYRPIAAHYDGTHTTITYEPIPLDQMDARYSHLIDKMCDKANLVTMFGGHW